MIYDSYELALPIISTTESENGTLPTLKHIFGTCFSIGKGYFLTAGHVGEELIDCVSDGDQYIVVHSPADDPLKTLLIGNVDVLNNDIALLKLLNPDLVFQENISKSITTLYWTTRTLRPLDVIRTCGFPYGIIMPEDSGKDQPGILQRSFQGHIVSSMKNRRPLGFDGAPFPVIETSFNVPRGLSGAPIIYIWDNGDSYLAGVVLGNSQSSMIIEDTEEKTDDGKQVIHHTIKESLSLGLAARNDGIFELYSPLLQQTIMEHLTSQDLIK